jgi:ankyrin repeat protein
MRKSLILVTLGISLLLSISCGAADDDMSAFGDSRSQSLARAALTDDAVQVAALASDGVDVNAISAKGMSPLYLASREQSLASMEALLEAGADPWLGLPPNGEITVPWIVVTKQDLPQLTLLLDHGMDPRHPLRPVDGSLLHVAAFHGWFAGVDLLIARGADVNFMPDGADSTVGMAISGGKYAMALHLMEQGFNGNLADLAWAADSSLVDEDSEPDRQRFISLLKARGVTYPLVPDRVPLADPDSALPDAR